MSRFLTFFTALTLISAPAMAQAPSDTPKPAASPVVLELFTSQSCGFCPPADALIGQMAQQDNIIALSCHVDYFNVSQNSLAKNFCTRRQNEYNRLIGSGPRYTPQLVVNGHLDMIGYQTGKVSAAVLKARAEKTSAISITDNGMGGYNVSLPSSNARSGDVRLWVAVYDKPQTLALMEGNNFGKKLTYYNVVSDIQDLGAWDGMPATRDIKVPLSAKNAGFAVVAQNVTTGFIIAAGDMKTKAPEPQTISAAPPISNAQ